MAPFPTGIRWTQSLKSKSLQRHKACLSTIYRMMRIAVACWAKAYVVNRWAMKLNKPKQNRILHTNVWISGRRKKASVFSCKRSHTYSLRTISDKLKDVAPGSHKPSPLCIWSPGLRVKKAANKDPSRQGWLCWPFSICSLGLYTAQLWDHWPSGEPQGTTHGTSFVPQTEFHPCKNMLHESEDMWTELSLLGWRYHERSRQHLVPWMCNPSCYWNGGKSACLPLLAQDSDSISSPQGPDTTFTSPRQWWAHTRGQASLTPHSLHCGSQCPVLAKAVVRELLGGHRWKWDGKAGLTLQTPAPARNSSSYPSQP